MKYCLHPTGSTCYDQHGLSFPRKVPVNWVGMLPFPWQWKARARNLPELIVFDEKYAEQAKKAIAADPDLPQYIIVKPFYYL